MQGRKGSTRHLHVMQIPALIMPLHPCGVQNLKLVSRVAELSKAKGCTSGQLALAWVHHQGNDVFPIPGTKRLTYLEENIAAAHIALSAEELQLLEDAVPASEVRWPVCLVLPHQGAELLIDVKDEVPSSQSSQLFPAEHRGDVEKGEFIRRFKSMTHPTACSRHLTHDMHAGCGHQVQ